jgi:hypothetical protein
MLITELHLNHSCLFMVKNYGGVGTYYNLPRENISLKVIRVQCQLITQLFSFHVNIPINFMCVRK